MTAKRLLDVLGASLGLLLLAPLMLIVAVCIKADSTGPIFFRQTRVGKDGALFQIHKFRTMFVDAGSSGPLITSRDDSRVTRTGRFLRRHKLDEIPQLVDVARGQMSLVGPRPEVPKFVALYPAASRNKILSVRPGVTDPASIAFMDEDKLLHSSVDAEHEYVQRILPAKLELYEKYVDTRTLRGDLRVLCITIARILFGRSETRS